MSDRKPESLYKYRPGVTPGPAYQRYTHVEASPADLVAAVRVGVESGAIEGEVASVYRDIWGSQKISGNVQPGTYLVIPVDGGEG